MATQELSSHGKTTINNENTDALHFFLDPADGMCNAGWLKNKSMSDSLFVLVQVLPDLQRKSDRVLYQASYFSAGKFKVSEFPSCFYRGW